MASVPPSLPSLSSQTVRYYDYMIDDINYETTVLWHIKEILDNDLVVNIII